MGKRFVKKAEYDPEHSFWMSIADMFFGLMMVFITFFVIALIGFNKDKIEEQVTKMEVAKSLNQTLNAKNVNATVDQTTGQVKISDLELFELNSYDLSPKGKQYLDKFIPIYVNTIFSNKNLADKIVNIVIEGHTDSQTYAGISSKENQFTQNMGLSLNRANSIEEYIFKTNYDKKYTDNLIKTLVVEGKSYSEPVLVNGKEDYNLSRRVELKLVVKDQNSQDLLTKK